MSLTPTTLRIRSAPSLSSRIVGSLIRGSQIYVDAASRVERDGYVWWQHADGWSAERSIGGRTLFMLEVKESPTNQKQKRFVVVIWGLNIRAQPGFNRPVTGVLRRGTQVDVDASTRLERDGFIWWEHSAGWSAERRGDGQSYLMVEVPIGKQANRKIMKSTTNLRIFTQPSFTSQIMGQLPRQSEIAIDLNTRVTSEHYVWVQYQGGWISEKSASGLERFLRRVTPAGEITRYVIQSRGVEIRSTPQRTPNNLVGKIPQGQVVTFNFREAVTRDGLIWVEHERGWSPWRTQDKTQTFLTSIGANRNVAPFNRNRSPYLDWVPKLGELIQKMPVHIDQTGWIQYFGNTPFAYSRAYQSGWYRNSQLLHSGFDFGNRRGSPVFAATDCTFLYQEGTSIWRKVVVRTGDFTFYYQHLTNVPNFIAGEFIPAGTRIGQIIAWNDPSIGNNDHLHFEVRHFTDWIIDPLVLMPNTAVQEIITRPNFIPTRPDTRKDPTSSLRFFYKSPPGREPVWNRWTKWNNQPILIRGGIPIGPRA